MLTAGVICLCVGFAIFGISTVVAVLRMGAESQTKELLSSIIGVLTFFVGIGLIVAHFVSKYA